MPLHHALLSLLADSESYGYQLKGAFERSAGPQWGALNIGHVYQLLERLNRDGLVAEVRAEAGPHGSDRRVYAITARGRDELARWLGTASAPATGYRDDLFLKLLAAARTDAATVRAVARRERAALLAELHGLRALARSGDDLEALLTEGAALGVEARLRLLDLAEEDAPALAAAARRHATAPARAAAARKRRAS